MVNHAGHALSLNGGSVCLSFTSKLSQTFVFDEVVHYSPLLHHKEHDVVLAQWTPVDKSNIHTHPNMHNSH